MSILHKASNGVDKLMTTIPLSKLQAVVALDAPVVTRAPHSAGVSSAASSTREASAHTLSRSEPCFITNVSAYTHEQAHWINAVRATEDKHRMAAYSVQKFLSAQGIVDPIFSLDDAFDASFHIAMDKYALFAITCSHRFLDMYIEIIMAENEKWKSQIDKGKRYTRELQVFTPSVRFAEYELIVLQPDHFLLDGALLTRYLRDRRGVIGLKHYKVADDLVLREDPGDDTSPRFPAFHFIGNRDRVGHTISPYLVILAAEIKFRRYLAANGPQLPPDYDSLMRKTIQVADLLYFDPAEHPPAFDNPILEVDMHAYYSPINIADAEMGFRTSADNDSGGSTARQQKQPGAGGGGGKRCASAEHWRHTLSGRDLELNDDDLDVLREIEESNRALSSHGQSLEQVETWRETIET